MKLRLPIVLASLISLSISCGQGTELSDPPKDMLKDSTYRGNVKKLRAFQSSDFLENGEAKENNTRPFREVEFDVNGELLREKYGSGEFRTVKKKYSKTHNKLIAFFYDKDNNAVYRNEYQLDNSGQTTSCFSYDKDGQYVGKYINILDENSVLIKTVTYDKDDKWNNATIYTIDDKRRIHSRSEIWSNNHFPEITLNTFYEDGRIIESRTYYNGSITKKTKVLKYDKIGNTIKEISYVYRGNGEEKPSTVQNYEFEYY